MLWCSVCVAFLAVINVDDICRYLGGLTARVMGSHHQLGCSSLGRVGSLPDLGTVCLAMVVGCPTGFAGCKRAGSPQWAQVIMVLCVC